MWVSGISGFTPETKNIDFTIAKDHLHVVLCCLAFCRCLRTGMGHLTSTLVAGGMCRKLASDVEVCLQRIMKFDADF